MKLPELPKIGRSVACILLVAAIFAVYELRLAEWQLVQGEDFRKLALSNQTDTMDLSAARGEILDKDGEVLAGNRTTYQIVYNAMNMVYEERNATIIKVVRLLEQCGEEWRDQLPIVLDEEGQYAFRENSDSAIATLKQTFSLAEYATAQDCMTALISQYDCAGYSNEDTRIIASVRYSMTLDGYSRTNPYVFAEDVSAETVGIFSEREKEFPGVEPRVTTTRYYGEDGTLAPHVVGYIGGISRDQYEAAVENGTVYDSETNPAGYTLTDTVGQTGIESAFEEELRGSRGKQKVLTDEEGNIETSVIEQEPEDGHSVHLTLDADLQRVANLSLEENVKANTLAKNCKSAAAVVLDVDTFGVLACASYPTYDMNLFQEGGSYTQQVINDNENRPMYNRALEGTFTPGSVFKPMVALAALQEGVISASSAPYNCNGMFEFYDMKLKCTGNHGWANIYSALAGSCNAYFCQVGLDLTIRKMDAYAEYFSLGTKTGVELFEGTGIMSSPEEYAENHLGATWTDGLTAQAAIGQCDNMFTPIQLATYCATIANGGVRLQTHFLDKITDYNNETVLESFEPNILSDAGLSGDVLGVVQEGMRQVAASPDGTAYSTFGDYPIGIAAKTGTAENSEDGKEPNLTFIAYAPIEDPEIAVAVVMEEGYKGAYAQKVAKDILDQYFGFVTRDAEGNRYDQQGNMIDEDGEILKTKAELDAEKEAAKATPTPSPSASPDASADPDTTEDPSASSTVDRGAEIPDTLYTGEEGDDTLFSAEPSPSASPESSEAPKDEKEDQMPDSPYWSGS